MSGACEATKVAASRRKTQLDSARLGQKTDTISGVSAPNWAQTYSVHDFGSSPLQIRARHNALHLAQRI